MSYFTGDWFEDNCMMHAILMDIEFYSGSERKSMSKNKGKNMGSMLYGVTWRGPYLSPTKERERDEETGYFKTKIYSEVPELKNIFKEFSNLYFRNFEYLSVQMNKNFIIKPHFDSINAGDSILCSFGDYDGGLTCVEREDGIVKYDSRNNPVKFDGSKYKHWVEDINSGDRYSLVFFSNGYLKKRIEKLKLSKKD